MNHQKYFSPDGSSGSEIDVLIIGSGAAGCAAALHLQDCGLSVLMITADRKPRSGPEGMSEVADPEIVSVMQQLGACSVLESSITGNYHGHQPSVTICDDQNSKHAGTDSLENAAAQDGILLNRSNFNYQLVQLLQSRKQDILFNTRVTGLIQQAGTIVGVTTDKGKQFICKYVIDASGKKRVTGTMLKLKQKFHSPPLFITTATVTGNEGVHPFSNDELPRLVTNDGCWTWISSNGQGQYTYTSTRPKTPGRMQAAAFQNIPSPSRIKNDKCRWRSFETTAMPGLLLCGDAALVLDTISGQGIVSALTAGIKASQTVIQCIQDCEDAAFYLQSYNNWYGEHSNRKIALLNGYYDANGIAFS